MNLNPKLMAKMQRQQNYKYTAKKLQLNTGVGRLLIFFVILAISKPHFILRIYNICYFALICIFYYF